jgi:uncharacterized integral membrane protein
MLVFIGPICISKALVLGLSCIMLYQIFYLKGGTKGPLLGKVLSICALQVHIFMGCYIVTLLLALLIGHERAIFNRSVLHHAISLHIFSQHFPIQDTFHE